MNDLIFAAAINKGGHYLSVNKFGRNSDIDTGTDPEDIWDAGGVWVPPTEARIHNIASSSTADDDGNTGAWTVRVFGLNSSYVLQSETVTMNGTANVATTLSYIMIHRMIVVTAGSNGANAGNITATAVTDSTITAQITAGNNQTLMAIYQVPANYTAFMTSVYSVMNIDTTKPAGAGANIDMKVKPFGEVYQIKHTKGLLSNGSSSDRRIFQPYFKIEEKSIIKVTASIVTDDNTDISAGFDLILVQNEFISQID